MRVRLNRLIKSILSLVLVSVLLVPAALPVFAKSRQTVRVGYVNGYGITVDESTGRISGYLYDYLQEIALDAGWDYEFIRCSWSEGLKKLATYEIDLFGPMQKTTEREDEYFFPQYPMGNEYGVLCVNQDNTEIYYNDLLSFNGMRVGTEQGNYYNSKLEEYCQYNNISVDLDYCEDTLLFERLESGAYDAILLGSLWEAADTSVVAKIATEPFYMAVSKENLRVLSGINAALRRIGQNDAYFNAKLDEKYYGDKSANKPALTREEAQYVATAPVLKVVCDPVWTPVEHYDAATDQFTGISIDLLKEIGEISGLRFSMIPTDSYANSVKAVADGQADLLLASSTTAPQNELQYTTPFMEIPTMLVGRNNIDMKSDLRVAIHGGGYNLLSEIGQRYPNLQCISYESIDEMIQALESRKENYALINTYAFDELVRSSNGGGYVSISTGIKIPLEIGTSKMADPLLTSVLNKSISRLSPEHVSITVFANTVNRTYNPSFVKLVQENSVTILLILAVFFTLLTLAIFFSYRHNQTKLKHMAFVDDLTGVPTLSKFRLDVQSLLKSAKPFEYSLLSMDIDHFKYINDTLGYDTGNLMLSSITEHFQEHKSDYTFIARDNADTFIFLLKKKPPEEQACFFQTLTSVNDHVKALLPENYGLVFSGGIYHIANPSDQFASIRDNANIARKQIKDAHSTTLAEYTADMAADSEWKKEVTLSMGQALQRDEFLVYLQPKYDLKSDTLVGAEALIRWAHPQLGLLPPARFIPLFEQNQFICKVDYYVFHQVCGLLRRWADMGLDVKPVSVNLSRHHLGNPRLLEELKGMCAEAGIPPSLIEIELTESIVYDNPDVLVRVMQELRNGGFSISVDDFGSGYSSLNMLSNLSADVLKIDKGFLDNAGDSDKGRQIIAKIIDLAKGLEMHTVAEGVETADQADMLRGMGCETAQGYYYAKPMSSAAFEKLLSSSTGGETRP